MIVRDTQKNYENFFEEKWRLSLQDSGEKDKKSCCPSFLPSFIHYKISQRHRLSGRRDVGSGTWVINSTVNVDVFMMFLYAGFQSTPVCEVSPGRRASWASTWYRIPWCLWGRGKDPDGRHSSHALNNQGKCLWRLWCNSHFKVWTGSTLLNGPLKLNIWARILDGC